MAGLLDGILVVSIEQAVAAPHCTQRLRDAGARVIKIERPEGDFARYYDDVVHGESAYFVWLNQGKESIALDIKQPGDARVLEAMIAQADIFVQNLAPGAIARSGFDPVALRARYPRLITCDISGYGDSGPARDQKAYDLLIQCETGLAAVTGTPDGPGRVGVSVADIACGMNAHAAILQALIARGRTGKGQGIAVSLFDTLAEWMAVPLLHQDYAGKAPKRVGLKHPSIAPYGAFTCGDGRVVALAVQNEREWLSLCRDALQRPEIATDPRFVSNVERVANRAALDSAIEAIFAGMDRSEAVARLGAAKVAFASVNEVADLSVHGQLRRMTVGSPTGDISLPARPVLMDGLDPAVGPVPALNGCGDALRAEFAA